MQNFEILNSFDHHNIKYEQGEREAGRQVLLRERWTGKDGPAMVSTIMNTARPISPQPGPVPNSTTPMY